MTRCRKDLELHYETYTGEDESYVDGAVTIYCELEQDHSGLHTGIAEYTGYDGTEGKRRVYWE